MSDPRPSRWAVGGVLTVLVLIWGTTWAAIRVSLEGFPPFKGVALRFAVAAVVLALGARVRGIRLRPERRQAAVLLSQAVCIFAVPYSFVYWAEQWVPSGVVSVLFATLPLFVLPLAWVFLPGERRVGLAPLGILAAFAGVATIFSDDLDLLGGPRAIPAAAALLTGTFFAALGQVVAKRWGAGIHPLVTTAVPMAIASGMIGVLAMVVEQDRPVHPETAPVLALFYLALVGSAVTFTLFYWVLHHVTALQLSLITFAIPVVAVTVGTLLMDEPVTPRILAGAGLVIFGVVFAARPVGSGDSRHD